MASTSEIRNRLIDALMTINNSEYLQALEKMIKSSNVEEELVQLTEDQKIMLSMSETDITNGNVVEHDQLNERELQWLKEK